MQLHDYIISNFTARIRANSKLCKLQKDNVVKTLYSKLERGMNGREFIETIYDINYEEYLQSNFIDQEFEDVESASESSDDEDIQRDPLLSKKNQL